MMLSMTLLITRTNLYLTVKLSWLKEHQASILKVVGSNPVYGISFVLFSTFTCSVIQQFYSHTHYSEIYNLCADVHHEFVNYNIHNWWCSYNCDSLRISSFVCPWLVLSMTITQDSIYIKVVQAICYIKWISICISQYLAAAVWYFNGRLKLMIAHIRFVACDAKSR